MNTSHKSTLTKLIKQQARQEERHPATLARYLNTKHSLYGLRVPEIRAVTKNYLGTPKRVTHDDFLPWHNTWLESDIFEVKSAALIALENKLFLPILLTEWPRFQLWAGSLDNWAHSDGYSCLVAKLLEESPKVITPTLKTWNTSDYAWERRQSLVSLFYYARQRTKSPPYTLVEKLITPLLNDPDIYVQKAVGWTLRECWQVYQPETRKFLLKHVTTLSSTAFSSSTEKVDKDLKEQLLKVRAEVRRARR